MANTIRIKRRASGNAGAPASLQNAELAFNEVDDILYYGKGTGGAGGTATTVEAIAGKGAYVALTGNQTVAGNKTFTGDVIATTQATSDNSTKVATTAFVKSLSYVPSSEKGAANGVATLDSNGLVPSAQLPSYVDDVVEYANLAAFPGTGTTDKIYVAIDTGKIYRWSGSVYVEISSAGTADTATKLATARTIGMTGDVTWTSDAFDGSANVTGTSTLASVGTAGTYTKVTTDAKGRVTSGTTLSASDIPTLTLAKISDAGTIASQNANNVSITGGSIDGITLDGGTF